MKREEIEAKIETLDPKELEIELEGVEELLAELKHVLSVQNNRSLDKDLSNKYINLNEKRRLINNKLKYPT